MSLIGRAFHFTHDVLHLPEVPGITAERAEHITRELVGPGSVGYYIGRQNSRVAEALLPGLELNYESNYSDLVDDIAGPEHGSDQTAGGSTPPPENTTSPGGSAPPPESSTPPGRSTPPPETTHPTIGEPLPPGYIGLLPGEETGIIVDVGPLPPARTPNWGPSAASLDAAYRDMAGGDRELSEAELFGSMSETRSPNSPNNDTIKYLSGIADISDDGAVNRFEASTTFHAMDEDGNKSVSRAEMDRYLQQLGITPTPEVPISPPNLNDGNAGGTAPGDGHSGTPPQGGNDGRVTIPRGEVPGGGSHGDAPGQHCDDRHGGHRGNSHEHRHDGDHRRWRRIAR